MTTLEHHSRWLHWNITAEFAVAKSASPLEVLKPQHACPPTRERVSSGDSQRFCIRRGLQIGDEKSSFFHFSEVPWVILHRGCSGHSLRNHFPTWEFPREWAVSFTLAPFVLHQELPAHSRCSINAEQSEEWFCSTFFPLCFVLDYTEISISFNPLGRKQGINFIQIKFVSNMPREMTWWSLS